MRCLSKSSLIITLAAMLISIPALAGTYPGQQRYGSQAKVSLQKAEHIALNAFHGKIISKELEKEHGGSGLRYSFDIRRGKTIHEVGVDARTGKVLENSVEKDEDKSGGDSD